MFLIVIFSLIQGFTEFLPISSQGHLILYNHLFDISYLLSLTILEANIIAHSGSLLAILIYYSGTLKSLIFSFRNILRPDIEKHASLLIFMIVSTIPIIISGYYFGKYFDYETEKMLLIIGITSVVFGVILFILDKFCLLVKNFDSMNFNSSLFIGLMQCLALIPGVSRSGAVITAMRANGYNRDFCVFYSNMLSVPVLLGAIIFLLTSESNPFYIENIFNIATISIFLLSFFFSIIFIHFLVVWVRRSSLLIFMIYRLIFGIALITMFYAF